MCMPSSCGRRMHSIHMVRDSSGEPYRSLIKSRSPNLRNRLHLQEGHESPLGLGAVLSVAGAGKSHVLLF